MNKRYSLRQEHKHQTEVVDNDKKFVVCTCTDYSKAWLICLLLNQSWNKYESK